jgi:hypothetical protein
MTRQRNETRTAEKVISARTNVALLNCKPRAEVHIRSRRDGHALMCVYYNIPGIWDASRPVHVHAFEGRTWSPRSIPPRRCSWRRWIHPAALTGNFCTKASTETEKEGGLVPNLYFRNIRKIRDVVSIQWQEWTPLLIQIWGQNVTDTPTVFSFQEARLIKFEPTAKTWDVLSFLSISCSNKLKNYHSLLHIYFTCSWILRLLSFFLSYKTWTYMI